MTPTKIEKLAERIARSAFTNVAGIRAYMIVLKSDKGTNLSSWCEESLADDIARILRRSRAVRIVPVARKRKER